MENRRASRTFDSAGAAALLAFALGGCGGVVADDTSTLPPSASGEAARCYEQENLKLAAEQARPALERDVLVLVDQTTSLPDDVRRSVLEQVSTLAEPGTRLSVGTFSSYTQNAHTELVYEGLIEPNFPRQKRDDAPMRALRDLDACLSERRGAEGSRLADAVGRAVTAERTDVQRSDVLANIKSFAERLKNSPAQKRVLILVSDLLENSTALSFYGKGAMRRLDPDAELTKVERNDLFGDLSGTRVFVIGAGLLPPDAQASRSIEELRSLEAFWKAYFERSRAESVVIGKPLLLTPID